MVRDHRATPDARDGASPASSNDATEITEKQLRISERELEAARLSGWQDNKPIVVLDRKDYPDPGKGNFGFVLCNIGRGFAVNVVQFDSRSPAGGWHSHSGLAAGEKRVVSGFLHEKLTGQDAFAAGLMVLVAEGSPTRTRRWNPTLNVIAPDGGFVHALIDPKGEEDSNEAAGAEAKQDIAAGLTENRARLYDARESLRFSRGIKTQAAPGRLGGWS